uniref:Uncharacterized protein n=1 Tax=Anguilla anguilla TaxID=7936 RepID=A0A0E9RPB3_ANGAN
MQQLLQQHVGTPATQLNKFSFQCLRHCSIHITEALY